MSQLLHLPKEFSQQMSGILDESMLQKLAEALQTEATTSIRLNPLKLSADTVCVANSMGKVAWCNEGYYLKERPAFTFDPLFHAGCYYVQESSSMFLSYVLRQLVQQPVMMLDLCAAPGGKSTVARSVLPQRSILFSNEIHPQRAQVLVENITRFGHEDVIVTQTEASQYAKWGQQFDLILADVPCSGEGMFRKEPTALTQWSTQLVEQCAALQRDIVTDIWQCLRPGGYLIYSTCTYNTRENEDNIAYIAEELGAEVITLTVPSEWHIYGALKGKYNVYRFFPHLTPGEGLCMAVLRKGGNSITYSQPMHKDKKRGKNKSMAAFEKVASETEKECRQWLTDGDPFVLKSQVGKEEMTVWAAHEALADVIENIPSHIRVLQAGIPLAQCKGKQIKPHPYLPLFKNVQTNFDKLNLNIEEAISYLQGNVIVPSNNIEKGWLVAQYQNQNLGLLKHIGTRANNLYPQPWKIKSTHLPDLSTIRVIES